MGYFKMTWIIQSVPNKIKDSGSLRKKEVSIHQSESSIWLGSPRIAYMTPDISNQKVLNNHFDIENE